MAEDTIPRNPAQALVPCLFTIVLYALWYNWKDPQTEAATLMGLGFIVLTWLVYMGSSSVSYTHLTLPTTPYV